MAKKEVLSEKETRQKLFSLAKALGIDHDLVKILTRYDQLLKNCTNQKEAEQIRVLGNVEIHNLFNFMNPLVVDGKEIIPEKAGWDKKGL
jgi:hypothetical protein